MPGDLICVDPTGQYADPNEYIIIPKGHVWVCGDNLTVSRDSRMHGPVPMGLVKGRIVAKIWPPSKWTIFRSGITYLD
jgi:inner membrane protease subunit 1